MIVAMAQIKKKISTRNNQSFTTTGISQWLIRKDKKKPAVAKVRWLGPIDNSLPVASVIILT